MPRSPATDEVLAQVDAALRDWRLSANVNGWWHYVIGQAAVIPVPLAGSPVLGGDAKAVVRVAAGGCAAAVVFLNAKVTSDRFWDAHGALLDAKLKFLALEDQLDPAGVTRSLVGLTDAMDAARRLIRGGPRATPPTP